MAGEMLPIVHGMTEVHDCMFVFEGICKDKMTSSLIIYKMNLELPFVNRTKCKLDNTLLYYLIEFQNTCRICNVIVCNAMHMQFNLCPLASFLNYMELCIIRIMKNMHVQHIRLGGASLSVTCLFVFLSDSYILWF